MISLLSYVTSKHDHVHALRAVWGNNQGVRTILHNVGLFGGTTRELELYCMMYAAWRM